MRRVLGHWGGKLSANGPIVRFKDPGDYLDATGGREGCEPLEPVHVFRFWWTCRFHDPSFD